MRRLIAALATAVLLLPAGGLAASTLSSAMLDQYFRLHWEAAAGSRGPEITGYVENVDRKSTRLNSSHER